MKATIYVPLALRLHAFGLERLHDPNWTGMELYDHLKRYMRRGAEPEGVLYKTLDRGVLWLLGGWLLDEFLSSERLQTVGGDSGEQLIWHLEEIAAFLATLDGHDALSLGPVLVAVERFSTLYDSDEDAYFDELQDANHVEELLDLYGDMIRANEVAVSTVRDLYAANYADRVFHDRELCSYIAQLVLAIGIDGGLAKDEEPRQWVERCAWPEWAKTALRARERGKCAKCAGDLVLELEGEPQVDHIVPISRGGTNDLVNLQMLCAQCNRAKSDQDVPVSSSIPPYLSRRASAVPGHK